MPSYSVIHKTISTFTDNGENNSSYSAYTTTCKCCKCKKTDTVMYYLSCCENNYYCEECKNTALSPVVVFSIEGIKDFFKQITDGGGKDILKTKLTEVSKESKCNSCRKEITEKSFNKLNLSETIEFELLNSKNNFKKINVA